MEETEHLNGIVVYLITCGQKCLNDESLGLYRLILSLEMCRGRLVSAFVRVYAIYSVFYYFFNSSNQFIKCMFNIKLLYA